ncbi:anti-sigma factor domain-containing protein [Blastococcus sp. URHD0036]|uniref:anti-sigma factor domain-containing protein n=1 Tax=Blastococcus sp. URHD0036 TaxID=1380356 RepID=UPI0004979B0B|nr:anti-sigma factor [Blastococcus sp. URHD0036]
MIDGGRGSDPHEPFDELAVGWALHALEPEDEAVFAAHLPRCSRCARTVAETTDVMGAMATDLPAAEPSDGLRDRLRAAVEQTEQVPTASPVPPQAPRSAAPPPRNSAAGIRPPAPLPVGPTADPRPTWRRILPNALVAAAAAAVLGLGAWNVVLDDARDEAVATAAEQARIVDSLLEPGTANVTPLTADGDRVATVVARDAQVQVVTQGLALNDRDTQTYVVWGTAEDADPVALGTFDVVRSQTDVRTVGSTSTGLDDYSGYAISIEPGREAPAEPSDIVANG